MSKLALYLRLAARNAVRRQAVGRLERLDRGLRAAGKAPVDLAGVIAQLLKARLHVAHVRAGGAHAQHGVAGVVVVRARLPAGRRRRGLRDHGRGRRLRRGLHGHPALPAAARARRGRRRRRRLRRRPVGDRRLIGIDGQRIERRIRRKKAPAQRKRKRRQCGQQRRTSFVHHHAPLFSDGPCSPHSHVRLKTRRAGMRPRFRPGDFSVQSSSASSCS